MSAGGTSSGILQGRSPYDILHVSQDADDHACRSAYRRLALKHHPDKGGDVEIFKRVNAAYQIVGDPAARTRYDREYLNKVRRNKKRNREDDGKVFFSSDEEESTDGENDDEDADYDEDFDLDEDFVDEVMTAYLRELFAAAFHGGKLPKSRWGSWFFDVEANDESHFANLRRERERQQEERKQQQAELKAKRREERVAEREAKPMKNHEKTLKKNLRKVAQGRCMSHDEVEDQQMCWQSYQVLRERKGLHPDKGDPPKPPSPNSDDERSTTPKTSQSGTLVDDEQEYSVRITTTQKISDSLQVTRWIDNLSLERCGIALTALETACAEAAKAQQKKNKGKLVYYKNPVEVLAQQMQIENESKKKIPVNTSYRVEIQGLILRTKQAKAKTSSRSGTTVVDAEVGDEGAVEQVPPAPRNGEWSGSPQNKKGKSAAGSEAMAIPAASPAATSSSSNASPRIHLQRPQATSAKSTTSDKNNNNTKKSSKTANKNFGSSAEVYPPKHSPRLSPPRPLFDDVPATGPTLLDTLVNAEAALVNVESSLPTSVAEYYDKTMVGGDTPGDYSSSSQSCSSSCTEQERGMLQSNTSVADSDAYYWDHLSMECQAKKVLSEMGMYDENMMDLIKRKSPPKWLKSADAMVSWILEEYEQDSGNRERRSKEAGKEPSKTSMNKKTGDYYADSAPAARNKAPTSPTGVTSPGAAGSVQPSNTSLSQHMHKPGQSTSGIAASTFHSHPFHAGLSPEQERRTKVLLADGDLSTISTREPNDEFQQSSTTSSTRALFSDRGKAEASTRRKINWGDSPEHVLGGTSTNPPPIVPAIESTSMAATPQQRGQDSAAETANTPSAGEKAECGRTRQRHRNKVPAKPEADGLHSVASMVAQREKEAAAKQDAERVARLQAQQRTAAPTQLPPAWSSPTTVRNATQENDEQRDTPAAEAADEEGGGWASVVKRQPKPKAKPQNNSAPANQTQQTRPAPAVNTVERVLSDEMDEDASSTCPEMPLSPRAITLQWARPDDSSYEFTLYGREAGLSRYNLRPTLSCLATRQRLVSVEDPREWEVRYVCKDLDFAANKGLDDKCLEILIEWLVKHGIVVDKLQLWRCDIGDQGALAVLNYVRRVELANRSRAESERCLVQEIHLSDNRITKTGTIPILEYLERESQVYPWVKKTRRGFELYPLWLRMNNNKIAIPRDWIPKMPEFAAKDKPFRAFPQMGVPNHRNYLVKQTSAQLDATQSQNQYNKLRKEKPIAHLPMFLKQCRM
ncbi:unnamed protein product [Amoebophrya sp. A25]|nr:unnamed protein product [Amoebophrya sp. A25]|eukprot:GSA25T00001981001.1